MTDASRHIRFVLARTSHPGNIGSAARAMRTMGFDRLLLVAPHRYPHPQVQALAAGADDVLQAITVMPDIDQAIAGAHLVLAMSARRRGVSLPEYAPREAAQHVCQTVNAGQHVAFVFGNEQAGLESVELARCHAMVRIPSVDDFSSLNLAQAVQVMAYETRLAVLDAPEGPPVPRDPPATADQMASFFTHLQQTLADINFYKGRATGTIELRLRKLFQRARPDARELRILHGILSDAQRMARLAGENNAR